jgi:hypothetical protein
MDEAPRRAIYARSRLQLFCRERPQAFFDSLSGAAGFGSPAQSFYIGSSVRDARVSVALARRKNTSTKT